MTTYYRPLAQFGPARTPHAQPLAGGWCWFDQVEVLRREGSNKIIPAVDVPDEVMQNLTRPRVDIAGLGMGAPKLMGILNVTPDSFSDGGAFLQADAAVSHAQAMIRAGADILDIGGESTRPGADFVPAELEISRTVPVIETLVDHIAAPISIDTRKAAVAINAIGAGAGIVNDVSGLSYDPELIEFVSNNHLPVCIMHAQGDPKTMQNDPVYDDVLLDVYDYLSDRIKVAEDAGIERQNIIIDPGIGFGKTLEHNLQILQNLSLFHGLGCVVLLGASRKRFIGTLGDAPNAADRSAGSIAVTLAGVAQGVQIHRVHDIGETRQALKLWAAVTGMGQSE